MKKPRSRRPVNQIVENNGNGDDTSKLAGAIGELKGLPEDVKISIMQSASFSGPLPPPAMFEKYEAILPGSADRILTMAEREQAIRDRDNRKTIHNDRMIICGSVVVSLALIGGGVYVVYIGQPILGGFLSLGGVIAGIFKALLSRGK